MDERLRLPAISHGDRDRLYRDLEDVLEIPMLILGVLMIPLLLAPYLFELTPGWALVLEIADWLIWAAFAAEFGAKLYLTDRRLAYLKGHWLDLLIVLLPLMRPLRIARTARALRLLGALRVVVFASRVSASTRTILARHHFQQVLLIMGAILLICALLVAYFERDGSGAIKSVWDALWWSVVTVTTVGYGDTFPISLEGRVTGVFLMLVGITFFGVLTANLAAYFVQNDREEQPLQEKLDEILVRLSRLEEALQQTSGERPVRPGEDTRSQEE